MRLILVRHGETKWNVEERIQGHRNIRLTKNGIKQSKLAAKELAKEKIDVIYSSDLYRCKHTVQEILKLVDYNVPVHYTKELRERSFGIFDGKKRNVYRKHIQELGKDSHKFRPENGENWVDAQKRIVKFLNVVMKRHEDKTVLFVTHGGMIKCLLFKLMKRDLKKWDGFSISNSSISIIKLGKKHQIKLINYTKHLEE